MVFELLKARVSQALVWNTLQARGIRSSYRDVFKDEKDFERVEASFAAAMKAGIAEDIDKQLLQEIADVKDLGQNVLDLEERSLVLTFRIFTRYVREVAELQLLEQQIRKWVQEGNVFAGDHAAGQRLLKDFEIVVQAFAKDVEELHDILLGLARVMRDQADAIANQDARERLRDMIVSIAGETRSRFKATFLRRKIRNVQRLEKREEDIVKALNRIFPDGKKSHTPATIKDIVNDVHTLATVATQESGMLRLYLEDSRYIIMYAVRHFFNMISNLLLIVKHEEELRSQHYFADHYNTIRSRHEEAVKAIAERSITVMRESYQELHKFDGLNTSKAVQLLHSLQQEIERS